jgi:hypothetical protein
MTGPIRLPSPGRWAARLLFVAALVPALALVPVSAAWAAGVSIREVIGNLTVWIVGLSAGLATLFLTIGGLRYMMAGGDPGEVEAAKRALRAAAIGFGIVILAPVLVTVLKSIVGAQ